MAATASLAFLKHSARVALELDFAASAGIAAPTSGTRTAKANRDFKLNMLASLFKGLKLTKPDALRSMPTRANLRISPTSVYAKTAD